MRLPNNRHGYLVAALWCVALDGILAWWVKGDLEMGWLIGIPVIVGGGVVIGAVPAVAFRQWRPALVSIAGSTLLSVLLLYAAINTPNHWASGPPAGLAAAASRFASDREAVKSAVEKVTRYPVELSFPPTAELAKSTVTKQGFSFTLSRTPPSARVTVGFEAGPAEAIEFEALKGPAGWQFRPRKSDVERIAIRPVVFERLFPDSTLIEVGGNGPYSRGQSLVVRTARSETEWNIVLLRVMDRDQTLREVRRYSRDELLSRFREIVAAAHLGPLQSTLIYFRPVGRHQVMYFGSSEFPFMAVLGNPRYWHAEIAARLSEDGRGLDFAIGRTLVRPRPGAIIPGDPR